MASGNRRPGPLGYGEETLYVTLPKEILFIVESYRISRRIPSTKMAIQRLLESHPDLTYLAARLYIEENTSPPI